MENYRQKTIKHEISCVGIGLHTGNKISMTLKPADPNTGIVFHRTDAEGRDAPQFQTVIGVQSDHLARPQCREQPPVVQRKPRTRSDAFSRFFRQKNVKNLFTARDGQSLNASDGIQRVHDAVRPDGFGQKNAFAVVAFADVHFPRLHDFRGKRGILHDMMRHAARLRPRRHRFGFGQQPILFQIGVRDQIPAVSQHGNFAPADRGIVRRAGDRPRQCRRKRRKTKQFRSVHHYFSVFSEAFPPAASSTNEIYSDTCRRLASLTPDSPKICCQRDFAFSASF